MSIISIVIFIVIGMIAGSLMGLLGIGCGLIVVPLLAFWLPHHGILPSLALKIAIATSLAVVLVTALSSMMAHHRYKRVQWYFIKQNGIGIIVGSVMGAWLVHYLNMQTLKLIFGTTIIMIAIYIGWRLWLNHSTQNTEESVITQKSVSFKINLITIFIGAISTMIGIGGGTFMIPLLRKLHFPLLNAIGTSVACGTLISLVGTMTMLIPSYGLTDLPSGSIGYLYLPAFITIAPTSLFFAQLGARIAARINTKIMQFLLMSVLLLIGLKMIMG